jgi:hypothetical protein
MRYRLYRFISDHSELYTFVRDRISLFYKTMRFTNARKQSLSAADAAEAEGAIPPGGEDIDELQHRNKIDLSAALLVHADDVITSSGANFYVIDIPARLSRTEFASPLAILPATVRSRLNIIAPLAALSSAARPDLKLYYEKGQGHFTPTGVAILVDEAVKSISASPRLTACAREAHRAATADEPHALSSAAAPGFLLVP